MPAINAVPNKKSETAEVPAPAERQTTKRPTNRFSRPHDLAASKCPFEEYNKLTSIRLASLIISILVLETGCSAVEVLSSIGRKVV